MHKHRKKESDSNIKYNKENKQYYLMAQHSQYFQNRNKIVTDNVADIDREICKLDEYREELRNIIILFFVDVLKEYCFYESRRIYDISIINEVFY